MSTDITIIGAGPTGLFGAFYAGLRGMSVRIVDSLPELGGQLTALYPEKHVYDMPGFPAILAKDLARQMAEQALRFRPEVRLGETAQTLAPTEDGWVLGTDRSEGLETRTLLITAGPGAFQPTRLGLAEEARFEGRGLQYGVRRLADHADRRVVVVGGGALLLRQALLTRFNSRAYLPEEPVLATARGLYKLALLQAGRKK
ncbi:MAG: NAD(P)/FAD-dependent oxidoreductase, partial [Fimbriimonadales bacterium]